MIILGADMFRQTQMSQFKGTAFPYSLDPHVLLKFVVNSCWFGHFISKGTQIVTRTQVSTGPARAL
jgi:hypothetical protein